jgi:hypothetical protein
VIKEIEEHVRTVHHQKKKIGTNEAIMATIKTI